MEEEQKATSAVEWHLETLKAAIARLEELYDERGLDPEVPHRMRVDDHVRLIREHIEDFEFEYGRLRELEIRR